MAECRTINCSTCGFEVQETFVEQKCPRCQSLIESKMACGSCSNCHSDSGAKKTSLLNKVLSLLNPKQL